MKTCKTCGHFKRLYTKYFCFLWRSKLHICTLHNKIADGACCENWSRRRVRCDISPQRFESVESDLKALLRLSEGKDG